MKVILRAVRIYGSMSTYVSSDLSAPDRFPIKLRDYPAEGEQSSIYAGAFPTDLADLLRRRLALSSTVVQILHSTLSGTPLDILAQRDLLETRLNNAPAENHSKKRNWFLSLVIDRTLDIDSDLVDNSSLVWLDWDWATEATRDFTPHAADSLNLLAAHALEVISSGFLEEMIVEDKMTFLSSTHEPLGWPPFSSTAGVATASSERGPLDAERLREALLATSTLETRPHNILAAALHWYLSSLTEPDPWKRFLWSCLSLETLSNSLSKHLYGRIINTIPYLNPSSSGEYDNGLANSKLVKANERSPLEAKFSIVALALATQSASEDVEQFSSIFRYRNKVAHGTRVPEEQLTQRDCRDLLDRYIPMATALLTHLESQPHGNKE